ncbi:MAG: hypothetical protein PUF65_08155 [Lachnospiraceae bacterium]|nr:hypothetical protein [Lachnospiraceae bacterium]
MKQKNPIIGIVWKSVLVLYFGMLFYTMIKISVEMIVDYNQDHYNQAESIERCDYDYYNRNFGGLRETLTLNHLHDEIFDKYWEVVDGYEDYVNYVTWQRAANQGVEESSTQVENYRTAVIENSKNCKFSDNQEILDGFVENMEL